MNDAIYECDSCYGECEFRYGDNQSIDCADCGGTGHVTIDKLRTLRPLRTAADFPGPIVGILALANTDHDRGMRGSIPFKVGDKFTTIGGVEVECIAVSDQKYYETARFSDGGWRYNREHDRGRATGAEWDYRKNIVPNYPTNQKLFAELLPRIEKAFNGNQV